MYFAILKRDQVASLINACILLIDPVGQTQGPYYVFSVEQSAWSQRPWQAGTVYLLLRSSFMTQEPMLVQGMHVHIAQLASLEAVTPLAKLAVTPTDFPFLADIRGHDATRASEYAAAMQNGGPWPRGTD
jgi:hypothetical protein